MKMANMDAIFDFMFTGMRDKSGVSCVQFFHKSGYGINIALHTCTIRCVHRHFNIWHILSSYSQRLSYVQ